MIGDSVCEELGFEMIFVDGVFFSVDVGRGWGSRRSDGRGSRVDFLRVWNGKLVYEMGLYMGYDEGFKGNVNVVVDIKWFDWYDMRKGFM